MRRLPRIVVMTEATVELDGQYRQLREGCGLLDRSSRGKLLVSGPEAAEYLQSQLTNEIEALDPGQGCYAALLDRKGHLQADMRVTRLGPEELWLDSEEEALEPVRRHLQMYKVGRDVEVRDLTGELSIISLIGPGAATVCGVAPGPEHAHREATVDGVGCRAIATRAGIDLVVKAEDAEPLTAGLVDAGAAPVSEQAAEILRIESGRPRFGAEMGPETMPAEAGIVEDAVSFTKGCYIGQEPVARLHYKGRPNRHLRGLALSAAVEPGATLRLGEKEVGRIGSVAISPAHGPIALAIVRREADPGAELAVGEDGVTARVVDLPFG
jgi:tRNA-modifying protein YgfZ